MAETLAQSLRTTSPPTDPTAALLRGGSIQARGKEAREQFPSLLTKSAEAAGELKRSELQAESEKAGREAAALEESGRKMREETQRIRGLEQPYQEFKAPEYTAADYAKGAATRALTAVILGGVAKTSALTQLKAIKAMQDAEKEGRQNDFLNAQLTFNEAEKKRVDFNERLKRNLDDFEKLLQTDTKAAMAKAKVMTADMIDGLAKKYADAQRYPEFLRLSRDLMTRADEVESSSFLEAQKAAARREEELIKAAGKGEEPGRLSESDKKAMRNIGDIKSTLNRVGQSSRPSFFGIAPADFLAKAIMDLEERGVSIPERVWNQLGSKGVNADTVAWWKDYYAYVAEVRNKLFGATLTPREQGDFRNFTISPATSYDVVERFFKNQNEVIKERAQRELDIARAYRVPDRVSAAYLRMPEILGQLAGADRERQPAAGGPRPPAFDSVEEADAAFAAGTIQKGDEITVGGRKAVYE